MPGDNHPSRHRRGNLLGVARSHLGGSSKDPVFHSIHKHQLVFNLCWEDPRIDRQLLGLNAHSKVVMITSAGCNALDYLLDNPAAVHTVDINPRQNALLELKLAVIKHADFDDLFAMFGAGHHRHYRSLYGDIRAHLSPEARSFWDDKIYYFDRAHVKRSFYYHGPLGGVAWFVRHFLLQLDRSALSHAYRMLDADTLEEQQWHYARLEARYWNAFTSWFVGQPLVMALAGTPRPQMQLAERHYAGGMARYVRDRITHVATCVPMRDNYFWRVFLTGGFTADCCPNYLKREHLDTLRRRIDRVHMHTTSISSFLRANPGVYSHFILLDHQDWLACHDPHALEEEWQLILANSRPGSRILMRSVSADNGFIPPQVRERLRFFPEITEGLHQQDRVGTYRSLHYAEVL
jgi:S-adenosylmethionine-diacylglycerol 3-amino-3-carboxypropyl transferase